MNRTSIDLSKVAQLGGHSFARTHRPANGMIGAELVFSLLKEVKKFEGSGQVKMMLGTRVTSLVQALQLTTSISQSVKLIIRGAVTSQPSVVAKPLSSTDPSSSANPLSISNPPRLASPRRAARRRASPRLASPRLAVVMRPSNLVAAHYFSGQHRPRDWNRLRTRWRAWRAASAQHRAGHRRLRK